MNVFMVTDMEGVAGVVSFADQSYPDGRYYDAGKQLVTAEVNAAVAGLVDGGADDILVWDGHGAGAILFEELHPRARLLHGRPSPPWSRLKEVITRYDVCVIVGQHAMAGVSTGNQNHTQNSRTIDYYQLNGTRIGEIGQIALFMGALGLPLIFLSGEQDACREAEALVDGITTVAVKEGLGRGAAISLSAQQARSLIRSGIQSALEQQHSTPLAPLVWPGPYVLEKRFHFTDVADAATNQPGVERIDSQTVRLRGERVEDIIYR